MSVHGILARVRAAATSPRVCASIRCAPRPKPGSGHPTHVLLGRRHHGGAVLRGDALRPARSRRTPTTIASCCRRDTRRRLLYAAWAEAGIISRDDAADAAALRLRSRGASHAAAAVGRRRHRIARAGTVRRRRHRAQRAPHRLGLSHLRAARRRRDRRRLGLGGRRTSRVHDKLDSLCGIIDVNALGQSRPTQWQHDMDASPRGGARSAGTRSSSTATTWRRCSPPSTRRGARRAGRR